MRTQTPATLSISEEHDEPSKVLGSISVLTATVRLADSEIVSTTYPSCATGFAIGDRKNKPSAHDIQSYSYRR